MDTGQQASAFVVQKHVNQQKILKRHSMQTCSRCNASSPDHAKQCANCHADLSEYSSTAIALKNFQANARIRAVRVTVAHDACPVCFEALQTYPKGKVPHLPIEGCSHEHGCRCFYEPVLEDTAIIGKVME
jgi:ribosomal protein L40E